VVDRIMAAGHVVATRALVRDDVDQIERQFLEWIENREIDAVISTGGTGLTGRDVTVEALRRVIEKEIEGFAILFHQISFQKVGTSTIQSRAMGGVASGTYLFALPGSTGAVKDGWDEILKFQLDNRHRPCNFVEIMPRLTEI
jgi:molybdenum cofactor biosynthesis protein B